MVNIWGLILTIIIYFVFGNIQWLKIPVILSSSIFIVLILKMFNIEYDSYASSSELITFFLSVATIALGHTLAKNFQLLLENKKTILSGAIFASICSILTTYYLAKFFHLDSAIIASLLPKSTTMPIAIEISNSIKGIPEITSCVVILAGLFGGLIGHRLLKYFKVNADVAIGFSMGATSHILGTLRCAEKNKDKQVSISTISLIIVGIATAILAPVLIAILK